MGGVQGLFPDPGVEVGPGPGKQVRGSTASTVLPWPPACESQLPGETGDPALGSASRVTQMLSCRTLATTPLLSDPMSFLVQQKGLTEKEGDPSSRHALLPGRGALATERVCEVMDKDGGVLCRSTEEGVH